MASSTATSIGRRSLIAVCQLNAQHDLNDNFRRCAQMIETAGAKQGCKMVFLPECFDYIGRTTAEQIDNAIEERGPYIKQFRELAKKHELWLALGGFHNKKLPSSLPRNSYLLIDSDGNTRATYDKLHLFDLDLPNKVRLMESEFSSAGEQLIPPVDTPIGRLGMAICYDLRFPELSLYNRYRGAQILSFPSSFTVNTGLAHWETLLRARAIETQCYVVAAAQTGKHNEKRSSYGHSMVVDPWGAVIAQCSEREDMCFAELDLDYVDEIRRNQPVFPHRRSDLYTLHFNEQCEIKDSERIQFGHATIDGNQCFYRSAHSYAFVNLMPVLPGHVLISTIRPARRLTDLNDLETADLFVVAKKVQQMLEAMYQASSTTVCVQDGPYAGQTIEHVHVHVVPRKGSDFEGHPDQFYQALLTHDKEKIRLIRTPEDMATEATKYREWFKQNVHV